MNQIKAYVRDGSLYASATNDYLREATDSERVESALTTEGHIEVDTTDSDHSTTVRIDDGDGNDITDGLDTYNWRRHACEAANRLGTTVYVSSSDASIGCDYPVEPGSTPEEI